MSVALSTGCQKLPVLTLYQPWAALLVHGEKRYETTRLPAPEKLISAFAAIAAAANESNFIFHGRRKTRLDRALTRCGCSHDDLPRGVAVGRAFVQGCYRIAARSGAVLELADAVPGSVPLGHVTLSYGERMFSHILPGRWLWQFSRPSVFLTDIEVGTVKLINRTFGIISRTDGTDVFLHRNVIPENVCLRQGETVRFRAARSKDGLRAIELRLDEPRYWAEAPARQSHPGDV